jgi:hypothetical protein
LASGLNRQTVIAEEAVRALASMTYVNDRGASGTPRCEKRSDLVFRARIVPDPPTRIIERELDIDGDQGRLAIIRQFIGSRIAGRIVRHETQIPSLQTDWIHKSHPFWPTFADEFYRAGTSN